nr:hypothetical protein [uncultured Shinella sp.]
MTGTAPAARMVFGIINTVCNDEAPWESLDQVSGKKHLAEMAGAGNEASGVAKIVGRDLELGA